MKNLFLTHGSLPEGLFNGAVNRILELQRANGAIPWFDAGVFDPWNHVEAAMGLAVAGRLKEAERAYDYLASVQEPDGSWWAEYGSAVSLDTGKYEGAGNEPKKRDTNFIAYVAVGIWHHYLLTGDRRVAERWFPMVARAIDFVLALQTDHGEVRWTAPDPVTPEDDALLTGNASIYKSIECAIRLATLIGKKRPDWVAARKLLGEAIAHKPHRFDRTWESKSNFSMDWYYPVLTGAITGDAAKARLAQRWHEFVVDGKGVRCVSGESWVTIAEGCELAMALAVAGQTAKAKEILSWQHQWRAADGAYWMGYQYALEAPWPVERPAWTAAAVLLATDTLMRVTPASSIFTDVLALAPHEHAQRLHRG